MKHVFIINPVAGKGKTLSCIPDIRQYFERSGEEYSIEVTQYPGHATTIASRYSAGEACRIYSVGGDGTLNEILNGMAGGECALAVIPSGSGNDFIRSITGTKEVGNILEATIRGTEREIDLASVNGRYFINISSVGFDAKVVYNTIRFKKVPFVSGSLAYILGILVTVIGHSNNSMWVDIDGRSIQFNSLMVSVANGKYCGGGMLASPNAVLDDGLLDVCMIGEKNPITILKLFPMYMKGEHGQIKNVTFERGKRIVITPARQLHMHVDGEHSVIQKAEFEIIPKGLKIIVPLNI